MQGNNLHPFQTTKRRLLFMAGEEETVECFQNTGGMRRVGSLYLYQGPLQKEGSADRSSSRLWQLLMLKGRDLKWHTENGAGAGGYE